MNIHEFAKRCGVSPATVSRYFSGNATMSHGLSERIRQVAEETGYQPSAKYQRRRVGGNGPIVTVTPYFKHRFQIDMLTELQHYADELGRHMVVLCQHESMHTQNCTSLIRSINPVGIVLLHEGGDREFLEFLNPPAIPMVFCSGQSITQRIPSVHIDDLTAAYDGANYLIRKGHKHIVLISDQAEAISSGSKRIMGCKKAFADADLQLPDNHIAHAWYSFADGYRAMTELLGRGLTFSAVFAFNDEMAAGALAALKDHRIRVPEDVSVLGFDNGSQAVEIRPQLTSVGQPLDQIARRSIDIILSGEGQSELASIILPHTIMERDSCRNL
jgi:DNA-binding LacI/PurR family transcriptional regulator